MLLAVTAWGCSLGTISIDVSPDFSGKIQLRQPSYASTTDLATAPEIEGARASGLDEVRVRVWEYSFARLSDLDIGGISFTVEENGEDVSIDVTVPLSPSAGWFTEMGITAERIELAREFVRKQLRRSPAPFPVDEGKFLGIEIELDLPWIVKSRRVMHPESGAPSWLRQSIEQEKVASNRLKLAIPIASIFEPAFDRLVVRVVADKSAKEERGREGSGSRFDRRLREALKALSDGRPAVAIELLTALRDEYPEEAVCDYNLACAYARSEKAEPALDALAAAVEKGYDDVLWMRADADLAPLRGKERFAEIVRTARDRFLDSIDYHFEEPPSTGEGRKRGLLIFMGGAGSDGSDWVPVWKLLAGTGAFSDTIVISSQHLSDDAEGFYDEDSLPDNAFTCLLEMAQERWPVDPARVVAGGFSAGAVAALELPFRYPERFPRTLVIEGASRDAFKEADAVERAKRSGVRVAVLSGEARGLFRIASELLVGDLAERAIPTYFRRFPQSRLHKVDKSIAPFVDSAMAWLVDPSRPSDVPEDAGDR